MAKKRISMDDMCGGALLQRFNMEMAKIGRNIMDPNTDPRKPRKLTISLTFKADESRKSLTTSISTSRSLAPLEPINTIMLAGQDIRTGAINIQELVRYGKRDKASAIEAHTLSALVEYIERCDEEFQANMLIHVVSPKEVRLISALDADRTRENLFVSKAEVSEFNFDKWYDQERFMIELQANFQMNDDLAAVMKMAGNIDKKNNANFTDDGVTQVATINVGVAVKADALVPNPVELIPFRTFQEVDQPASKFVFRVGDKEVPAFKLVEAENNIWKNQAIENVKRFLRDALPEEFRKTIPIIG